MNVIQGLMSGLWVEHTAWTLIHFIWEGAAIAAIYAVVRCRMLSGSSSPRARYILACVALCAMAAAPLATWYSIAQPMEQVSAGVSHALLSRIAAPTNLILPDFSPYRTTATPGSQALSWVVAIWFAGAMAFWIRMMGGWVMAIRLRSKLARSAPQEWCERFAQLCAKVRLPPSFRLLVSPVVNVPTVIGWLRPVVLVPIGFLTGLPSDQVEAVLLHELAHIRRNDYLVNMLQGVAEALLFYHPAVWWISGHIRAERELCCDDIAVSAGGDTFSYAQGLAELALTGRGRLNTTLAANGGSVAERIERLLGRSRPSAPRSSNAGIAVTAVLITLTTLVLLPWLHAQAHPEWQIAAGGKMEFEVASVKVSKSDTFNALFPLTPDDSYRPTGGRFVADFPLVSYIQFAYKLWMPPEQVGALLEHLPKWAAMDHFVIEARAEGNPTKDQMRLMIQSLLADRFKLAMHFETRQGKVLALSLVTPGKTGPRLRPHGDGPPCDSAGDPSTPTTPARPGETFPQTCGNYVLVTHANGERQVGSRNTTLGLLAGSLPILGNLGRTVIDRTGLDGRFDFVMEYVAELTSADATSTTDAQGPTFLQALRDQLGLKLESTDGPIQTVVVDHIERPSEN